jgi:AsmA protein
MKRFVRVASILLGLVVLLILGISLSVDANSFRPMLESQLSAALGRQVHAGDLKLSLLSGGVAASDLTIADDPAFRRDPFLSARSLHIGVEMMPLMFSKKLNITSLNIERPEIVLMQNNAGIWNFSSLGAKPAAARAEPPTRTNSAGGLDLSVKSVKISDGRLTFRNKVLRDLTISISDFSAITAFPFAISAAAGAGGHIKIEGKAGPISSADASRTPFSATIKINRFDLVVPGLGGVLSADGSVNSDGTAVAFSGHFEADKLKLAAGASPARRSVKLDCAIRHDLAKRTGAIQRGDIRIGKAFATLTGVYDLRAGIPIVNVKLAGNKMPLEELEAMLPAFNFSLPNGSSLKGGSATVHMAADGATDRLVSGGSLSLENAHLVGFDLGGRMSTIQKLAGIKSGPDTLIEVLSADVKSSPEGTNIDHLKLVAPTFADLSGDGSISPKQELDFRMHATLHTGGAVVAVLGAKGDTGVPFSIQGTASNPIFKADVKGMVSTQLKTAGTAKAKGLLRGLLHR